MAKPSIRALVSPVQPQEADEKKLVQKAEWVCNNAHIILNQASAFELGSVSMKDRIKQRPAVMHELAKGRSKSDRDMYLVQCFCKTVLALCELVDVMNLDTSAPLSPAREPLMPAQDAQFNLQPHFSDFPSARAASSTEPPPPTEHSRARAAQRLGHRRNPVTFIDAEPPPSQFALQVQMLKQAWSQSVSELSAWCMWCASCLLCCLPWFLVSSVIAVVLHIAMHPELVVSIASFSVSIVPLYLEYCASRITSQIETEVHGAAMGLWARLSAPFASFLTSTSLTSGSQLSQTAMTTRTISATRLFAHPTMTTSISATPPTVPPSEPSATWLYCLLSAAVGFFGRQRWVPST